MEIEFRDPDFDRLETDPDFNAGFGQAIVKAYRKRVQWIRAARDERDFYEFKSWHFEKLRGNRGHQRSIRLNDQWRLIIEIKECNPSNTLVVVGIEDYH
ncbi:MAG: type II toxin-antitoxin system RelE/ParE family toxin [Phycisphaerales bacterium]|nr:type II toxin-antitoxin system RelE/ParE family toxin [Phycisphaerales bacterium]